VYCALLGSFGDSRDVVVHWTIAVLGAFLAWLPGKWVGRFFGNHALAWFCAVVGGTFAFVLLSNENVPKNFRDVAFETSLIHGTIIASVMEIIVITGDVLGALHRQPTYPSSPVVLTSMPNEGEAAVIVAMLAERGIKAHTTGDFRAGLHALALGEVYIVVRQKDLDHARIVLAEIRTIQAGVPPEK
jgi:hypothetical protein